MSNKFSKTRKISTMILSLIFCAALSFGLIACNGTGETLTIDVPERIEEDLGTGTYVVPVYDVVNSKGVIMSGYTVRLKSATDPDGQEAEISREASTVVTLNGAGEYKFVYTADASNVAEATVIVDFADRTAPTINLPASKFPTFYITNGTYSIPEYSIAGDFDSSKCYVKVFYNDDEDVSLTDGEFTTEKSSGKYTVLVHVEDAAGNYNEYRYVRDVYSPETYDPATVIYFNDELGAKQVSADESSYSGKYVSVADGGKAYGSEKGSYKVVFEGIETNNNEAYFSIDVPAISNISSYRELEMYVFIEDEGCANGKTEWVIGSKWWNDQKVKTGEWTRVTWSVDDWGNGTGANVGATMADVILTGNISGTRIRLIPDGDYKDATPPHGTVYFSAMRAVSWEPSTVTAGEHVSLSRPNGDYGIGQKVNLFAAELDGKTFDCFILDGQPISSNYFYASEARHTVEAHYVDGELNADNMLWGNSFTDAATVIPSNQAGFLSSNNITAYTAGESKNWALSFDVAGGFNADEATNQKFGVSIYFGNTRTLEFQVNGTEGNYTGNFKHYGNGNYNQLGALSDELVQKFINASEEAPVHIDAVRLGDYMYVYVDGEYFYTVTIPGLTMYGDYFGYAYRKESKDVTTAPQIVNAKAVTGEAKATLVFDKLASETNIILNSGITSEKNEYRIGENVNLFAPAAPDGQKFLYFTVNGKRISGTSFIITGDSTVDVVFAIIANVTFSDGASSKDELVVGGTISLEHDGAPEGKLFDYYLVNGTEKVFGNTYVLTEDTATIAAVYATVDEMTWLDGTNGKTMAEAGIPENEISSNNGNGISASVLGDANTWAIRETVYGGYNGNVSGVRYYFGFMISSCNLIELQIKSDGSVTIGAAGAQNWNTYLTEKVTDRAFYSEIINATEENPVTFIAVRKDSDLYLFANDKLLVKVTGKFNYSNKFGYGKRALAEDVFPTTESREYLTDTTKIDALIAKFVVAVSFEGGAGSDSALYLGNKITLKHEESQNGQVFDYYLVNGTEKVFEDRYTLTAETETIVAIYATADNMTWFDGTSGKTPAEAGIPQGESDSHKSNGQTMYVLGDSNVWAIRETVYGGYNGNVSGVRYYFGFMISSCNLIEFQILSDGKVTVGVSGSGSGWTNYLTETISDRAIYSSIMNATAENPVSFMCVRRGSDLYLYVNGELLVKATPGFKYSNKFGYGQRAVASDVFPTSVKREYITDTAKVNALLIDFAANVTFSDGASYAGELYVGSKITLKHDSAPEGKFFDCYLVNGTEKVFADSYVITSETKTIVAVYATADTMSWLDGTNGKTMAEAGIPENEISSNNGNGISASVLGDANTWAIRETVYGGYNGNDSGVRYYFGFMISSCNLIEFQILSDGTVTIGAAGSGNWTNYLTAKVTDRAIYSTIMNASKEKPVTFTCIRKGSDLYLFANDELLVKVTGKFNYSNKFGYGQRAVGSDIFPTTESREYLTDTTKIDALIAKLSASSTEENR